MQAKVWKYAGFASAVVGLLCYALSSSFNYLFGEWNLLKIFLFVVFSFITCVVILFAEKWQHSRSHQFKAHTAFLVLTITSVYSFFLDKLMNGKPADAYSLISCAAFAVMSLSLSKQTQCGFEVDFLYFFLGCLLVQLMKTKLPLVIVGVGFSYSLVVLRSSFPSMNAAAQDNAYSGISDDHFIALVVDPPHPGLRDDNSADPDVDSLQLASDAAAADNEYPGIPDDNSGDPDVDSLPLASTDIASSMMEQLSTPPAAAVNGSGYFQDAGPDAMPGNPYQQQLHQRQSRRKLERTHTVLLTTDDNHDRRKYGQKIILNSEFPSVLHPDVLLPSDLFSPPKQMSEERRVIMRELVKGKELATQLMCLIQNQNGTIDADGYSSPSAMEIVANVVKSFTDAVSVMTSKAFNADDGSQVAAYSNDLRSEDSTKSKKRVLLPAAKDPRGSHKRSNMLTTNLRHRIRHRSSRERE